MKKKIIKTFKCCHKKERKNLNYSSESELSDGSIIEPSIDPNSFMMFKILKLVKHEKTKSLEHIGQYAQNITKEIAEH